MKALINDLLSFSRFSRHEISHQSIDMHNMVVKVVDELKAQNNYTNAEVSVDKLPEIVSDYMLILQVWRNLISNALKYSAHKIVPKISIKCIENDNEIIYEINDNGVGFDMQYADKLFGVFQRLHSDKEFEGTGVGLAIVQRIINRLNGRIWAESKVNEGASFFFAFKKIS
jgi:light-regulated signal transduction histidine kinase (bacteriophytochrome)